MALEHVDDDAGASLRAQLRLDVKQVLAQRPAFPHDNPDPEDQLESPQVASGGSASFVFLDAHAANVARRKTPLAVNKARAVQETFWAYSKLFKNLGSVGAPIDTW